MTAPPTGGAFYGPMVICDDFAGAFRLYHGTIGLQTEVDGLPPWVEIQSDGVRMVLLQRPFWEAIHGLEPPPTAGRGPVVFAVQIADVDALYERLRKSGTAFESAPTDRPMMGVRSAVLRHPEGTLVEVTTKLTKPLAVV